QLLKYYYPLVHRVCLARLGDHFDAEDAAQEVFLRATRHQGKLGDDPRPWLVQTAKTVCIDEYRRRSRRAVSLETACPAGLVGTDDPERQVVGKVVLDEVLSCLTAAERKVVTEKWLLDRSHREAGCNLGVRRR